MNTKLLFIQAMSPLHAGTGQGVDVIDLPIAREKSTGIPYLPGSSIKGVLRDAAEFGPSKLSASEVNAVFGAAELENAGAAVFADARLLLLPVRSLAGTFAYVTSPYLLKRFIRDAQNANQQGIPDMVSPSDIGDCLIAEECVLEIQNKVVLEELDLTPNHLAQNWANWFAPQAFDSGWQDFFKQRFCIVHDDAMAFLLETATEVVARIALEDDTKTVATGALWYEEALPVETVLVSITQTSSERRSKNKPQDGKMDAKGIMGKLEQLSGVLQFGGKSSVGRGVCQLRFSSAAGGA
jgi:CRISPR-associated protein Cmr4